MESTGIIGTGSLGSAGNSFKLCSSPLHSAFSNASGPVPSVGGSLLALTAAADVPWDLRRTKENPKADPVKRKEKGSLPLETDPGVAESSKYTQR